MQIFMGRENKMAKRKWIAVSILTGLVFIGCGGESENTKSVSSANTTPQIEVTEGAVDTNVSKGASKSNSGQFYYSYNKENNNSTDKTEGRRTTIDAYLNVKSPYEKIRVTLMIKRLSNDYIIRCSACHDDYANGVVGPSLLGRDADFIYKRIMAFKTGEKKNILMKELVSQLDDAKLKSIAQEIANFNKEIQKLRSGK